MTNDTTTPGAGEELKPCPFCGAVLERSEVFSTPRRAVYVHPLPEVLGYRMCPMVGNVSINTSNEDQVARWNQRPAPPRPVAGEGETKPVAWLCEYRTEGWSEYEYFAHKLEDTKGAFTVTPLYAGAPPPPAEAWKPDREVLRDVEAERHRQIAAEGWTPDHDDEHRTGELAKAAACYAAGATFERAPSGRRADGPAGRRGSILWPWDRSWWKPKDRRRDLIRAAALIVAEIERLDRALPTPAKGGE